MRLTSPRSARRTQQTSGRLATPALWRLVAADSNSSQLAKVAKRLYEIGVNAACDERFFSQAGIVHSKLRNRLQHDKVTMMVQVKAMLHAGHSALGKRQADGSSRPTIEPATSSGAVRRSTSAQADSDDLTLPDIIADQDEFDEAVNEWFAEL